MDIVFAIIGTFLITQYFVKMKYKQDKYEITRLISTLIKEMDVMSEKLGRRDFVDYLNYTRGSVYKSEYVAKLEKLMHRLNK